MAERKRKTNRTRAATVTSGSAIRFQQPKSARKPKQSVTKKVAKEVNPVGGFADFLREYTVVTLAIGFVVATQVQALVKLLIAAFVDPFTKVVFGHALSNRTFTWQWHGRTANFNWGAFVYGLIGFLVVLIVFYLIIKIFQLDKLKKPDK
jgi:large-conductance mechanosensitive channel